MRKLITFLQNHLRKYFVSRYFKTQADKDYLHFLASTANHNHIVSILMSEYSNDEEKFESITNWCNRCIDIKNGMNKKHGFKFYSETELETFKIHRDNSSFHQGLKS